MTAAEDPPPPQPLPERAVVADSLRRKAALWSLWGSSTFRRDGARLLAVQVRSTLLPMLGLAMVFGIVATVYLIRNPIATAVEAYHLLARAFGLLAALAAAPIYAGEQRQGTFELLWLASGSERAMLAMKVRTLLLSQFFLHLPAVLIASSFLDGTLPMAATMLALAVNTLFITAVMALLCTYFTQAWVGGLIGAGVLVPLLFLSERFQQPLNPFSAPFDPKALGVGRAIAIALSVAFLSLAANRLRKTFR